MNNIVGTITKGLFKDKPIEVIIGKDGTHSAVYLDGKELENCKGVKINVRAGEVNTVEIELSIIDQLHHFVKKKGKRGNKR